LAAAGMGGGSGSQLAGLQQYGQNMASQEYTNQFNRLSTLAGVNAGSPGTAGNILSQQANQQGMGLGILGNAVGKYVGGMVNGNQDNSPSANPNSGPVPTANIGDYTAPVQNDYTWTPTLQ